MTDLNYTYLEHKSLDSDNINPLALLKLFQPLPKIDEGTQNVVKNVSGFVLKKSTLKEFENLIYLINIPVRYLKIYEPNIQDDIITFYQEICVSKVVSPTTTINELIKLYEMGLAYNDLCSENVVGGHLVNPSLVYPIGHKLKKIRKVISEDFISCTKNDIVGFKLLYNEYNYLPDDTTLFHMRGSVEENPWVTICAILLVLLLNMISVAYSARLVKSLSNMHSDGIIYENNFINFTVDSSLENFKDTISNSYDWSIPVLLIGIFTMVLLSVLILHFVVTSEKKYKKTAE